MTFEVTKETFDLFCETGHDNRQGMILEVVMKVTHSPKPLGEMNEEGQIIAISEKKEPEPALDSPEPAGDKAPEKKKGGAVANLAGRWCPDKKFQEWLSKTFDQPIQNEHQAAEFIRDICNVTSRSHLDHDREARAYFDTLIRKPYNQYLGAV